MASHRFTQVRRGLALATIGTLTLGLVACGDSSSGSDPNELVIQSVWTKGSKEGDVVEAAIAKFEDASGAKVKLVDTGESTADVYENDVLAGKQADVILANLAEKTNDWVTNGAVVDMNGYLSSWGMTEKIRPEAIEEWRDDNGKLIGLPFSGFSWPVWYNTDLLAKAGIDDVPTTVDDLLVAAKALKEAGIAPMAVGGSDWSGQKLFLQIVQNHASADTTKKVFASGGFCDDPDIFKGIELFVKLRDSGVFIDSAQGYNADSMNSLFYTGEAAMMSAGSWAFTNIPDDIEPNTYLGGFPITNDAAAKKPTALQGYTGIGVMLSKNGEAKADLVKQFVEILYSTEIVADFVGSASLIPAATTATEATINNPLLEQTVSDLDDRVEFVVMPDTVVPGPVADPMISATALAFSPGNDAKTVCAAVDATYSE